MNLNEKAEMVAVPSGRYNVSLALVIDKCIFAIGGNIIGNKEVTEVTEVYDVIANKWYLGPNLNKGRCFTSCCVLNHRYIYIFPGYKRTSSHSTIEMLDLGFTIDPSDVKKLKWQLLKVKNRGFSSTFAYGSMQLDQNNILIFGGTKGLTFTFDT